MTTPAHPAFAPGNVAVVTGAASGIGLAAAALLVQACVLGLRDYVRKNGFSDVLLGLSGGIDSALVAALAVDALGAAHVLGVRLPSPYTSRASNEDAVESARLLGIRFYLLQDDAAAKQIDPALAVEQQWRLLRRDGKLKSVLMDPTFMVGIGPIYSDEILFAAGIRHDREIYDPLKRPHRLVPTGDVVPTLLA